MIDNAWIYFPRPPFLEVSTSVLWLVVCLVLFASNSTMRPINMCPEKFLPSCGTWRTIVTDRKVFAQVRIFSSFLLVLFFHKEPGRKSSSKKNALGQTDSSYHCRPFGRTDTRRGPTIREGKIQVQREQPSKKDPKL